MGYRLLNQPFGAHDNPNATTSQKPAKLVPLRCRITTEPNTHQNGIDQLRFVAQPSQGLHVMEALGSQLSLADAVESETRFRQCGSIKDVPAIEDKRWL
jgi:hypothetical protein